MHINNIISWKPYIITTHMHAPTHMRAWTRAHTLPSLLGKKLSAKRLPEFLPLGDLFCWQGVLGQTHLDSESFQILQQRQTVSLLNSFSFAMSNWYNTTWTVNLEWKQWGSDYFEGLCYNKIELKKTPNHYIIDFSVRRTAQYDTNKHLSNYLSYIKPQ